MNAKAERLLAEAVPVYTILRAGNNPRESWTLIANKIIAARKADPDTTQSEIGARFSESQRWVSDVISWRENRYTARDTPFARDDWEHRKKQIATQTPVKQADRVKMAEKLLEDPKVVKAVLGKSTIASRGVTNAVVANEAKAKGDKARQTDAYNEIKKASLSGVEGRLPTMIMKINEWALALSSTRDDLRDLRPSRQTELCDRALSNLVREAEDSREVLGHSSTLRVVEGQKKKKQIA